MKDVVKKILFMIQIHSSKKLPQYMVIDMIIHNPFMSIVKQKYLLYVKFTVFINKFQLRILNHKDVINVVEFNHN